MEFSLDQSNATYQIRSYQDGHIIVNQQTFSSPILVMPEQLLAPWGPKSFEDLSLEHFKILLPYQLQVVLLGTGPRLRFPDPKLFSVLTEQQIGVEVMDTKAACRTYAVLMAEERKVAAALLC